MSEKIVQLNEEIIKGQLVAESDGFFLKPGPQTVADLPPTAGVAVALSLIHI